MTVEIDDVKVARAMQRRRDLGFRLRDSIIMTVFEVPELKEMLFMPWFRDIQLEMEVKHETETSQP
jgi:hypothetical protein